MGRDKKLPYSRMRQCAQREDLKYQRKSVAGGLVCKLSEFCQLDRSGRGEAVLAQRTEFVLYSSFATIFSVVTVTSSADFCTNKQ